jgi:ADP-ribose pyrophosphatase YjhB (NUDIX family)
MEDQWLAWAKKLQAIASTGLHFGESDFDKERYAEVAGIAEAMLAAIGTVPIDRIRELVPHFAKGYATPQVDVRGAVLREDKILLVRERADGLWTLPGGFAEVGLSAAENVVKEVREEAGLHVAVQSLYGIRHKAKHPYRPDVRDFYKFFFVCTESVGQESAQTSAVVEQVDGHRLPDPQAGVETSDAAFFMASELPPLSTGRVLEKDILGAFEFSSNGGGAAFFD